MVLLQNGVKLLLFFFEKSGESVLFLYGCDKVIYEYIVGDEIVGLDMDCENLVENLDEFLEE